MATRDASPWAAHNAKLTWLVLGGDPAARSHRAEQHELSGNKAKLGKAVQGGFGVTSGLWRWEIGNTKQHQEQAEATQN